MSDVVIQVDRLWKKYRLGVLGTGTLRHDFNRWLHRLAGKPDPYAKVGQEQSAKSKAPLAPSPTPSASADPRPLTSDLSISSSLRDDEMWALRDVSFEVKQGEILGIIGRNGAGKSTLLKILSRVTAPTSGEVRVKGRIASLLEVGTGFHPELTGRENIFLNGAILGMTKGEIGRKFDEIVAFAEIEKFIDTPVKRYSSGMYVRLAFAVAAHLEPEILIVDEVLAVGDAAFQEKCLGKMQNVADHGRTVLFVSHNMSTVQQLCSRCLLMRGGGVSVDDKPSCVIRQYLATSNNSEVSPSSGPLRYATICQADNGLRIVADYEFPEKVTVPSLGVVIKNYMGQPILGANPQTAGINAILGGVRKGRISLFIKQPKLRSGKYLVSLWLGDGVRDHVAMPDALALSVVNVDDRKSNASHENIGSVYPECRWSFESSE